MRLLINVQGKYPRVELARSWYSLKNVLGTGQNHCEVLIELKINIITLVIPRATPVFSAFITGIAQVLDRNPDWGIEMLPLTLHLMLFCPAPEVVNERRAPSYTLGLLDSHLRHSWLMTLLIYLYKVRT